jgi:hypothetical protein
MCILMHWVSEFYYRFLHTVAAARRVDLVYCHLCPGRFLALIPQKTSYSMT